MPKVEVEAPKSDVPAIDTAKLISGLTKFTTSLFTAKKGEESASINLAVALRDVVVENDLDKATANDILCEAIASAWGVKVGKVKNSPKQGGDSGLYSNVRSVILNVVFCQEENKKKRDKAITDKQPWEAIKSYAKHGVKNKPRNQQKEDDDSQEYTAEKAGIDITKLILKMDQAEFEFDTIEEMFLDALEAAKESRAKADAEKDATTEAEEKVA